MPSWDTEYSQNSADHCSWGTGTGSLPSRVPQGVKCFPGLCLGVSLHRCSALSAGTACLCSFLCLELSHCIFSSVTTLTSLVPCFATLIFFIFSPHLFCLQSLFLFLLNSLLLCSFFQFHLLLLSTFFSWIAHPASSLECQSPDLSVFPNYSMPFRNRLKWLLRAEERCFHFQSLPYYRPQEHFPITAGKLLSLFEPQVWSTLVNRLFLQVRCRTLTSFDWKCTKYVISIIFKILVAWLCLSGFP